jgi:hypothetical protein
MARSISYERVTLVVTDGSASAIIPLSAKIGIIELTPPGGLPTVKVTVVDIFNPKPVVKLVNFEYFQQFYGLTPSSVMIAITSTINSLDAVRGRKAFQLTVPFTDLVCLHLLLSSFPFLLC